MDVLNSQLAFSQLWQLTRTANSPAVKEATVEFQMLLMNGNNEPSAENQGASASEHREPASSIKSVPPIESSDRNMVATAKAICSVERSDNLHLRDMAMTVVENPYRWFATGIMSFVGKDSVDPGFELNVVGQKTKEQASQPETVATRFVEINALSGAKSANDFALLNAQQNSIEARSRNSVLTTETQRAGQFSAIADYLRKRCTVVERVDDIHIIVRDYDANDEGRERIGSELLQAFSQFEKPIRITWNGKDLTANNQKGEGDAG